MPLISDTRTIHSLSEQFAGCLVLTRDLCTIVQQELVHDDAELPRERFRSSCRTAVKRIEQIEHDCRGILCRSWSQPPGIRFLSKTITLCTFLRSVVEHIESIGDLPRSTSHKKPSLYYFSFSTLFDRVKILYRRASQSVTTPRQGVIDALRLDNDSEIDREITRLDALFKDDIVRHTDRHPVLLRLLFVGRDLERLADTAAEMVQIPDSVKARSSGAAEPRFMAISPINGS